MKSRPAPLPPTGAKTPAQLLHDPQVKRWIERLEGDASATPQQLSEEKLRFVLNEVHRRRGNTRVQQELEKAMDRTLPVLAAPKSDRPLKDLREHIYAQPEMLELWRHWSLDAGARGPKPPAAETKAVMSVLAMTGHSAHVNDAYEMLDESEDLRQFFSSLDQQANGVSAPQLVESSTPAPLVLPDYSRITCAMKRAAASATREAWKANIEMLKALKALYPQVGTRLLVESTAFPSWSPQRGSGGDPDVEARLRSRAKDSGFRAFRHTAGGKRDLTSDDSALAVANSGTSKWWRGWYAQGIFDQATGQMIVGRLFSADEGETKGLIPLLSMLFELWPELDGQVEMMAGDSAFDNDPTCRMLEVDYGIHPVFRLHDEPDAEYVLKTGQSRDGTVRGYTHEGRLRCSKHNALMEFRGMESAKRSTTRKGADEPLAPGQSSSENNFRIRAECTGGHAGCGRVTLRAMTDWNRLTHYPHYSQGRPDLYAMRVAMLTRVSTQAESYWQRLKAGRKVATSGTDRGRMPDRARAEAIFALSCTSLTALVVADQRAQHGIQLRDMAAPQQSASDQTGDPAAPAGCEPVAGGATAPAVVLRRAHLGLILGGGEPDAAGAHGT